MMYIEMGVSRESGGSDSIWAWIRRYPNTARNAQQEREDANEYTLLEHSFRRFYRDSISTTQLNLAIHSFLTAYHLTLVFSHQQQ